MLLLRSLLLCLLLAAIGLIGWGLLHPAEIAATANGIVIQRVTSSDFQDSVRATNVSFEGRDDANRPIRLRADSAVPTDQSYQQVELEAAVASLDLGAGQALQVQSATGRYDRAAEQLNLAGEVTFASRSGFEMRTREAAINLADRSVISTTAVEGSDRRGNWQSEGLQLLEGGDRVILTGKSSVTLLPAAFGGADALPGDSDLATRPDPGGPR